MELAGEKWRESKLYPVICSIRVQKSEKKKHFQDGLALTDDLCCNGATINKMENTFCKSTSVVMDEQPNYNALVENFPTNDTRFVQQKTEKWFDIRKEAKVTGSTCNSALGLGKLKQQRKHFDQVMKGVEINEEDTRAISQRLIYGNEHEIDAIATLTSKVLPLYYPDLKYFEEGCMRIPSTSSESFMVVSPDGSLRQSKDELPEFMYENKCKAPDSYDPTSYYSIPNYYVVQLISEMNAYNCQKLIFTCWSEQSMTTFLVQNDRELWSKCWEELVNVYGSTETKAPTKFSLVAKELKDDIRVFTQSHVTLIGEFRACSAIKLSNTECIEEGAYKKGARSRNNGRKVTGIDKLRDCLQCVRKWFEEAYELLRVVASEILVFMVNDLDRIYHSDLNNAHPIAYALKGPSMSTEVLRNMTEEVIKTCEENGVEIVATASDGQWHQNGVRDNWKQPLTLHQLHRDHWSSVTSRDKSKLLTEIKNLYCFNSLEDILYVKRMGCIDVLGHGQDTPIGMKSISVSNVGVCDNDSTNCSDEGKDDSYSSYCGYEGCLGGSFVDDVDEETLRNVDEVISETLSSKQEHNKIDMCQIDQSCEFDIGKTCLYNSNYEYQYTENPNGHQDHDTPISLLEQAHSVLFDDTHYWDSLGYDYILNDVSESTIEDNYVPIAPMEVQSMEFIEETTNFEIDDNICITNSCIGDALTVRYETETGKIDDSVLRQLLDALCKDDVAMKKHDWSSIELVEFSRRFASKDEMKKYFLRHELFIMANYLECRLTSQGASVSRSWPKDKLNDYLHQLIMTGITPLPSISSKSKKRHILSLKKMAYRAVSKMPKIYLGIKMAEYTWAKTASEWRCKNKIPSEICFEDTNECVDWFTQPSIGEDGNIRFHFTDACHILTCLRTKICTTGISGLRKEAWEMAALSKDTMLNVSIVLDCIDKQDVALARRMFDKDVEECMERNGSFFSEAKLVGLLGTGSTPKMNRLFLL
ncbi:hypothetical protein DPMN_142323 [Dreissena polymorpha]|uniref:YqaJ viral recombinase domain-containing protein n=1 Tax=Dreissena polymorpha TaxID=45954 RepID=A0A9D4GEC4_DREPO|nr:hypothetical protein DPMN_142323 [Dreissena polymorpha]